LFCSLALSLSSHFMLFYEKHIMFHCAVVIYSRSLRVVKFNFYDRHFCLSLFQLFCRIYFYIFVNDENVILLENKRRKDYNNNNSINTTGLIECKEGTNIQFFTIVVLLFIYLLILSSLFPFFMNWRKINKFKFMQMIFY
jgi:hypothetical protein